MSDFRYRWAAQREAAARVAASGGALTRRSPVSNPENTGSQRLIAIAAGGTGQWGQRLAT